MSYLSDGWLDVIAREANVAIRWYRVVWRAEDDTDLSAILMGCEEGVEIRRTVYANLMDILWTFKAIIYCEEV